MADKKVKKILIFGMPRTGTTVIQQIVTDLYKLINWSEPFNMQGCVLVKDQPLNVDPYQWLSSTQEGVFKLLSQNLAYIDMKKLLAVGDFDLILLCERTDLVDCCLSLYWASFNNIYHYQTTEQAELADFYADTTFVTNWCRSEYRRYFDSKNLVTSSKTPYNIINYEEYMYDNPLWIGEHRIQRFSNVDTFSFKPTNLPYQRMCRNVREVEEIINKEIYAKRIRT